MSRAEDNELAFAGPLELSRLVRERELSARELVQLSLARIERIDPRLNAFRETLQDLALTTATQIDGGAMEGRGPLAGVPIAIKDDMPFAGQPMTRGSKSPAEPQPNDAEPLRRFREAGAIPVGITRVPELMLFPWTASDAGGVTRNPWNLSRTPGGSSGGSAAAVAAGLVAAAGASDGGGSIRIPAACCGLVGMKPTRGRVSSQPLGEGWLGLATFGALARTVADSALLLDVIHGSAAGDRHSIAPPRGSFLQAAQTPPAGRLRIAISTKLPHRDVRAAVRRTAHRLRPDRATAERARPRGRPSAIRTTAPCRSSSSRPTCAVRMRSLRRSSARSSPSARHGSSARIGGKLVSARRRDAAARQAAADDRPYRRRCGRRSTYC